MDTARIRSYIDEQFIKKGIIGSLCWRVEIFKELGRKHLYSESAYADMLVHITNKWIFDKFPILYVFLHSYESFTVHCSQLMEAQISPPPPPSLSGW